METFKFLRFLAISNSFPFTENIGKLYLATQHSDFVINMSENIHIIPLFLKYAFPISSK